MCAISHAFSPDVRGRISFLRKATRNACFLCHPYGILGHNNANMHSIDMEGVMDQSLRNLAGLLRSSNHELDISNTERRKLLQKVVYLAQALGLPLNYSFSWYIHGPYSPHLTKDYYELDSQRQLGESIDDYRLVGHYEPIAQRVCSLLSKRPEGVQEADWAELLASIAFLRREAAMDASEAKRTIREKKRHVADHYDLALKELRSEIEV